MGLVKIIHVSLPVFPQPKIITNSLPKSISPYSSFVLMYWFILLKSISYSIHDLPFLFNKFTLDQATFSASQKCRLWADRYETLNYMISRCSKLAQRWLESRHDRVGKRDQLEIVQEIKICLYWQTLTQEQKLNLENLKRIMNWEKTTLPSLRNIE